MVYYSQGRLEERRKGKRRCQDIVRTLIAFPGQDTSQVEGRPKEDGSAGRQPLEVRKPSISDIIREVMHRVYGVRSTEYTSAMSAHEEQH